MTTATQLQLRHGTLTQLETFVPADREIIVVDDDHSLRVGDGATVGGHAISGGSGGISDAPNDGHAYLRENDAWVQSPTLAAVATSGAYADLSGKPATAFPTTFFQNTATRTRVANSINTGITTAYGSADYWNHGGPLTSLKGVFYNGVINSNAGLSEKPNTSPMTIKMTVQYPIGTGTPVVLTWSGLTTGTISGAGGVANIGESDETPLGFTLPDGARYRIDIQITCASGIVYSDMGGAGLLPTDVCITAPSRDYTLDVTRPAGNATNVCIYAWAVGSSQATRKSVYTLGTSISYGYLDNVTNSPTGDIGLMARQFGKLFPYTNGGCSGESAQNYLLSNTARSYLINKYHTAVPVEHGTNDILNYARTQAQAWADLQSIYALYPTKSIAAVTIPPLVGSTSDGFVTEANQTAGFDVTVLNASIRASGKLVYDVNYIFAGKNKVGVWAAPNDTKPIGFIPGVITVEGIHPNYVGHQVITDSKIVNPSLLMTSAAINVVSSVLSAVATSGAYADLSGKPTIPVAAPYTEYQVAGFGSYGGQNQSGNVGDKTNYKRPFIFVAGGRGLQLYFINGNGLGENSNLYAFSFSASIYRPSTGEMIPLTFGGSYLKTFTGDRKYGVWSDALDGFDFMPGEALEYHMFYDAGTGLMPTGMMLSISRGDAYIQSQTQTDQTQNTSFTWPTNFPAVNIYVYAPMGMRSKNSVRYASTAIYGDSWEAGYGSTALTAWTILSFDGVIDYTNLGSPGEDTQAPVHLSEFNARRTVGDYARNALWTLGVNSVIHNFDAPGTQKDWIDCWVRSAMIGQRVFQQTVTPFTDNTNTPLKDAVRAPLNAWLRDGAPLVINSPIYVYGSSITAAATSSHATGVIRIGQVGHPLTQVVDVAALVEVGGSTSPTGAWQAGLYFTGDGGFFVHPNNTGHSTIAAAINPTTYPLLFSA